MEKTELFGAETGMFGQHKLICRRIMRQPDFQEQSVNQEGYLPRVCAIETTCF